MERRLSNGYPPLYCRKLLILRVITPIQALSRYRSDVNSCPTRDVWTHVCSSYVYKKEGTLMRTLKSLLGRSLEDRKLRVSQHLWMNHQSEFEELSSNLPGATPEAMLDFVEFTICNYATASPLSLEQARACRDAKYLKTADLAEILQCISAELLKYKVIAQRRDGIERNINEYREWIRSNFRQEGGPFDRAPSYAAFHEAGYAAVFKDGRWVKPRNDWRSAGSNRVESAALLRLAG